jgi:hypothetical protein
MEKFNLRKRNDMEVKEQYRVKVWESIAENIKTSATQSLGYYELKQHKPWFDEECSKLLGRRKQAKLQSLQNPS